MDDDDDVPALSAETFAALQEFYAEQAKREEILTKLESDNKLTENIIFEENWQLSQFWYDEKTIQALVHVIDQCVQNDGRVALISCPTLFVPVKRQIGSRATVTLLEYDRRFEIHGSDYVFYDYNHPLKLPADLTQSCDLVVADPPFLSEECITKTSETIKLLAKNKIVVCTGAVMKDHVEKMLQTKACKFEPKHRNNLANEFSCYANFNLDSMLQGL
ncbi:EEF1A lysine methyltransferase 1 [Aricia agestis]|uniref:EEF1A lysine methyltransferase 1 n=1 Tax=Aricia agestis TaxID=91739 RepID=UPI001C2077DD|nr:EEF1A lysine methyltransferase 1 [Aricia agestis]